jgi:uncharacterized membrane protein YccF (DUF307 family)
VLSFVVNGSTLVRTLLIKLLMSLSIVSTVPSKLSYCSSKIDSISFVNSVSNDIVSIPLVQPVNVTVYVTALGITQIVSHTLVGSVTALKHKKSTVVGSTFALVTIDQDGPASYPDNPRILVTNN